jgi:L-aminopeptidase/D-esterase-like protein
VKRREFAQSAAISLGGAMFQDMKKKSKEAPLASGAITDVAGIKVGHHTLEQRPTGCTVVLCEDGAIAGVDVRGAAPGTRETDLLDPINTVEQAHAIALAGGSAFGLDTATGVMRYLEEKNIGFNVGVARVPIVPAAILFDLSVGDPKIRPDAQSGYLACKAASTSPPAQGSIGAGAGATIGKLFGMSRAMKGGIGTASIKAGGFTVGALIAVNSVGDIYDPRTGALVAGARTEDGKKLLNSMQTILNGQLPASLQAGASTTIGAVATDAILTKAQANKIAQMAHDGLARAINPVHTPRDGDTLFALATGKAGKQANVLLIGALAAEAVSAAVLRAVRSAHGLPGLPSASEL